MIYLFSPKILKSIKSKCKANIFIHFIKSLFEIIQFKLQLLDTEIVHAPTSPNFFYTAQVL